MNKEKIIFNVDTTKEGLSFEAETFFNTLEGKLRRGESPHHPVLLQDFGRKERIIKRNLILPRLEELDEMVAAIDSLKKIKPQIFSYKIPESKILAGWLRGVAGIFSKLNRMNNPRIVFEYPRRNNYRFWMAGWVTKENGADEKENSIIHINLPYAGKITGGKDIISTLIHEWLHHFFDELELKELTDAGRAIDEDHTEQFASIEKKIGLVPTMPYGQGVPPPRRKNERY